MIIYYITAVDLTNFDAQRTHVLEVISEMNHLSEDVTLFTPLFSQEKEPFNFKYNYIPVFLKNSKLKFIEYEFSLFFYLLWHIINKRPDILYIRKGYLTFIPTILAKFFRIKCIIEVNGFIPDEIKLSFNVSQSVIKIFSNIEKFNLRLADKIVTVTEGIKKILYESYKIKKNKIKVIPNGVNTSKFFPITKIKTNGYQLGFVGNLVNWSGLEYLIKSLPAVVKEIKNVQLIIIGDGVQREYLENLTHELNISANVKFTGFVPPNEIPKYINQFDICYLPAKNQRNARIGISPIKLYEYLACGVPVIVTAIDGMTFVAEEGVGFVVEPENTEDLTLATLELLKNDNMRKLMSKKALQFIKQNYTWKITTQKILKLSNDLLYQ